MSVWVLAEARLVAQMLMTAGVALLALILILNLRRRGRGRGRAPQQAAPDPVPQVRRQHQMQSDLRQMMVELEGLTRRFASQLDSKTVHLEKLLEEADAKIEVLRGVLGDREDAGAAAAPDGSRAAGAPPPDPKTRRIYQMADAGREPVDIAREMDEQVGAIELILALRTQG